VAKYPSVQVKDKGSNKEFATPAFPATLFPDSNKKDGSGQAGIPSFFDSAAIAFFLCLDTWILGHLDTAFILSHPRYVILIVIVRGMPSGGGSLILVLPMV